MPPRPSSRSASYRWASSEPMSDATSDLGAFSPMGAFELTRPSAACALGGANQSLTNEGAHFDQIVAGGTIPLGELGDGAGDLLCGGPCPLGDPKALAERGKRLGLFFGDLAVDTGDPAGNG